MTTKIFSMYNNKGGVGKTTLAFNIAAQYADENPSTQVLVIDMCPQANISQYLLGGGEVGYNKNQALQNQKTRRNVVGFLDWLMDGNSDFKSIKHPFKIEVHTQNKNISQNLYLIAGDSFLESLSLALNYAVLNPANKYAWSQFMTAIKRLCELEFNKDKYSNLVVFIDCNPSFSIYTQMALVSSDYLIIPMMADYSSLEGLRGIMTLLFGKYPTSASQTYAEKIVTFSELVKKNNLNLPVFWEFIFNNFTSNLGVAKAYESLKDELCTFCYDQYKESKELFAPVNNELTDQKSWENTYLSSVKDFHTSGKVSASLGIPLHKLPEKAKYDMPNGDEVTVPKGSYKEAREHLDNLVSKFKSL